MKSFNMVLPLLVLSAWINYIDRGTLSVAAPVLGPELQLDPTRLGVLLSAFFWTYAGLQPMAGWIVDRYPVKWVYACGFAIWCVATIACGLATSFWTLFAFRVLLGAGESVAYPSYAKVLTTQLPEERRGFANALIDAATKGGPALGTFVGSRLLAAYGWRTFFFVMGGVGLLWLLPWMRTKVADVRVAGLRGGGAAAGPSFFDIICHRAGWGTCCGLFFFNYVYYFLLTWLPGYLMMERKMSLKEMGVYGALPYLSTIVATLTLGWWSDRRIRKGSEAGETRRRVLLAGLLLCALTLPGALAADQNVSLLFMIVAFAGLGVATSNLWAVTQCLAGPVAAGRWTGLQNGVGNLGGVAAPILTGVIVSRTGSFVGAFAAASCSLLLSAFFYRVVVGPVRPLFEADGQDRISLNDRRAVR